MPTPDKRPPESPARINIAALLAEEQQAGVLAYEVAMLRQDIAALRAELAPVPSLIVTGQQALREFRALAEKGGAA